MTQYQSKSKGHKEKDPSLELSVGQVLAAAGATVLGAVLAKLLNLWGTIPGTAFLSVFSAIGSVLILRAIRSTGDRVKAQIQAMAPKGPAKGTAVTVELDPDGTGEGVKATPKIPETAIAAAEEAAGDEPTAEIPAPAPETHLAKSASRKRTLLAILVSSVLVFGLTIGTLYLLGALTGDPERLINADPDTTTTVIIQSPGEDATSAEETPSESASPSESPSASPSASGSPSESPTATASPSETPSADTGQGGSEATPTPETQDETSPAPESTTAG
ncbi:hypothetical protein [Glycomyces terrestris]|uniref:Uncharacterized protein n=1 Tax=Glycomyces terrestris TaxID=2493553 RepID=A0A426V5J1_9ACTN|nr:hypothetical protein [Glycomyces terrestris]RRS02142.1 hypothetical protein EIW28_05295 [Glycomyces terrestris]